MVIPEACPECGSTRYKKNGHTRHGKQNHCCKTCERQFSAGATPHLIAHERRTLVENLLRERISLRGICRAVGVSLGWLLHFMVECFATCPDHLQVKLPTHPSKILIHKLEAEADEMWSFVTIKSKQAVELDRHGCQDAPDSCVSCGRSESGGQRLSCLVRDTLSFSKKVENHIGAIKFFICHYNLEKAAALPV